MLHPGGGLTKDYHDGHDSATTSAAAASGCVSHPGDELTKDYYDDHDSASDCVSHRGGRLNKDLYNCHDSATTSGAAAPDCVCILVEAFLTKDHSGFGLGQSGFGFGRCSITGWVTLLTL